MLLRMEQLGIDTTFDRFDKQKPQCNFGLVGDRQLKNVAKDLADAFLEDLSRSVPDEYKTITACAVPERQEVWKKLDILPISTYHEVFEAYHKSGCAVDGDWRSVMQQFLRCGLAFTFSGVVGASIATDCLFGVGDRVTSKVNIGALDLWVADVQDVFPSIMEVARCFKTTVVTTSESARLPGAERYEDVLLKNNILILSNGCASFPLMKLGYCAVSGKEKAGDTLREFLEPDLPPVWHVGECIDNTRSSGIFAGIAGALGHNMYEMPFAFSSPEWGIDTITKYCGSTGRIVIPNVIDLY